jgi:NADPH:quinone reductase-like Zn-dependent oxidoreductase
MKLGYRIASIVFAVVVAAIATLAVMLSHTSPCGVAPAPPANTALMKAAVNRCYGPPDVVKIEDIEKPTPKDNEVLVKVHAASANPLDWHYMRGEPYIMRAESGLGTPTNVRLGVDYAGTVEAVGRHVTRFKPGDEIFGDKRGAFAEYVAVPDDRAMVSKPPNITFEQAAAMPIAAITALQALRDQAQVKPGQKVLINGASGGVGTYAVQLAKSFGAEVTGVCSTRNAAMVQSLGADHVIDYSKEDFTQGAIRYDVIIDSVGNHSFSDYRKVMTEKGTLVIVGGPSSDPWLGPMSGPIKAKLMSPFVSQKLVFILADVTQDDLALLRDMSQAGKLTSVIDRSYKLNQAADAIRYVEAGHARGKVVITME